MVEDGQERENYDRAVRGPLVYSPNSQRVTYLAVVFDFSGQRSAAVQWVESLPPNIREAIEQERAEIGMDREQVMAALGKPDHKVRERQRDGTETEEWIYGYPPAKTIFVRFAGDTVVRVTEYL